MIKVLLTFQKGVTELALISFLALQTKLFVDYKIKKIAIEDKSYEDIKSYLHSFSFSEKHIDSFIKRVELLSKYFIVRKLISLLFCFVPFINILVIYSNLNSLSECNSQKN
ncbi:hypothetical protein [Clostridium weizhouense]|uniref:Uncharacterized protein n=1 Tax=Clostridium weizhouense TaxID=2859781 RepID=A0ABS7APU8_9CLOT|nr:hypothetical protein [Clostridium weizhouense]MBW6410688.1 hypothetical protein [Clostridium weizhouense]